jgi:hypothetical protein
MTPEPVHRPSTTGGDVDRSADGGDGALGDAPIVDIGWVPGSGHADGADDSPAVGDVWPLPSSYADPDWGVCRVCGLCLMLDEGVLPEHSTEPDRAADHRSVPAELRCRGEGHPPL